VELLPPGTTTEAHWRNRLIQADNLHVLSALRAELAGKVDLIYIDPPFGTGSEFEYSPEVGGRVRSAEPARRVTAPAYTDDWGPHRSAWFTMMHERLRLAHELLAGHGTLYIHVDWTLGHHLRVLLDEVFGAESSLGEIVWSYGSPSGGRAAGRKLVKAHDFILVFAKCYGSQKFRPIRLPYSERYVADWFKFKDEDGRRYRKRYRRDKDGTSYYEKQYLDESKGVPASTVWTDIQQVYADPRAYKAGMTSEITGYPTQKPLKLLERIIELSSDPKDLVLDFFAGSGTTLLAAERTGRRWIGCDQNPQAIQLAARRLLALPSAEPFSLEMVGATGRSPSRSLDVNPAPRLERDGTCVRVKLAGLEDEHAAEQIERWSVGTLESGALASAWTAFRTRKERALPLESPWMKLGERDVAVHVIDVLGRSARFVL